MLGNFIARLSLLTSFLCCYLSSILQILIEYVCRVHFSFYSDLLREAARTQGLWLWWRRWNPEYRLWKPDGRCWEGQDPVRVFVISITSISWIWLSETVGHHNYSHKRSVIMILLMPINSKSSWSILRNSQSPWLSSKATSHHDYDWKRTSNHDDYSQKQSVLMINLIDSQSWWSVIKMIIVRNGHSKPSAKGAASPQGQGCPRCSCYVYHADQVNT